LPNYEGSVRVASVGETTSSIERLVRKNLLKLEGYSPIVPVEVLAAQAGLPVEKIAKLDGNENLYGPSPRVKEALADYGAYHIYPDPSSREVCRRLADYVGLGPEYIVAGSGSDELIDLVLRLVVEPGDRVINCVPTFGMYSFNTEVCGGETVSIPRRVDYSIDLPRIKAAIDGRTKVIFLASPNNPTGNVISEEAVRELAETGLMVVVDEAYFEFSGVTMVPLVPQYDNLVVLRTFSKWAGLAGLRAGYGLFSPTVAALIDRIKPPYNVNVAAQVAMLASLDDLDYLRGRIEAILTERERLFGRLQSVSFLRPIPSQANFILCAVTQGSARELKAHLDSRGVFVRYFDTPLLRDFIRISVGRPEHTDLLMEALASWEG